MKQLRSFLSVVICLLFVSVAHAGLINGDWSTGDETGWTEWRAPWGLKEVWDASGGVGKLSTSDNASFGWYQVVAVPAGTPVTVDALWTGHLDSGNPGWSEVMLFTSANPLEDWAARCDAGAVGDIAFKKDIWGMNPPTDWGWELASLSPHPSGNHGSVTSLGYVVVGLKLGGFGGDEKWTSWDNIVLTGVPEPATMLLLGLGLMGLAGMRRFRK